MPSVVNPSAKRFSPVSLRQDSLAAAFAAVAQILGKILQGRNLDSAMQSIEVPTMVRSSVVDMTYNTLRAYGHGEILLGLLLSNPLKQREIQSLLLVALWRLEEKPTDRHTTVDQAVTAAGALAHGRFRNLVNGVLRNYLRRENELKVTIAANDVALWRHPRWWIEKLRSTYPQEWQAILIAGNSHPPLSLRVNKRVTSVAVYSQILTDIGMAIAVEEQWGLRLLKPVGVDAIPGFHQGTISVQDLGAQRTAALLDLQAGQRVLDACAAPGGKTAHILEWADVEMLALEAEPKRAQRIHENLDRLHLHAQVKVTDCRHVNQWWDGRNFDRILADVPCSASGVVRRHPDAKYLRRPEDVYSFAATQREIIDALWPVLAPGGKMLYCTCSVFPEENSQQVAAFLERHPDAQRMLIAGQDELQLLPNADHDGFYFALLRKRVP